MAADEFYISHKMLPLPVTVCLISGAEEKRIGRTLASVNGWAAEIVVVLNEEVTDRTEDICQQYGAKVFRERWKGFVAQKNSAADKATQPWLLGLDADELVSDTLKAEIRSRLAESSLPQDISAFSMPRMSFYLSSWIRHGDWYPDRKVRVWRRGSAQWGGTNLHEKLMVHGRTSVLRCPLLHYSFTDLAHHLRKVNSYGDLFAAARVASGRSFRGMELLVRPAWRFFRSYILRLGFLDGWAGFCVAGMVATETFIRYAKLLEAARSQAPKQTCLTGLAHHLGQINSNGDLFAAARIASGRPFRGSELLIGPAWRFFRSYILRLGFLDGWAGFCVAGIVATETFIRCAKLLEAERSQMPEPPLFK